MPRKRPIRHRLLLDEGVPIRKLLLRVNARHDLKHVRDDLHKSYKNRLSDYEVYQLANKLNRNILTLNGDDFKELVKPTGSGVIDLSSIPTLEQIDKKLLSFLSHNTSKKCKGKFFRITGESK